MIKHLIYFENTRFWATRYITFNRQSTWCTSSNANGDGNNFVQKSQNLPLYEHHTILIFNMFLYLAYFSRNWFDGVKIK